jgi:hypothetical protein
MGIDGAVKPPTALTERQVLPRVPEALNARHPRGHSPVSSPLEAAGILVSRPDGV